MSTRNWQGGIYLAYKVFRIDIKQDIDYKEYKKIATLKRYHVVQAGGAYDTYKRSSLDLIKNNS